MGCAALAALTYDILLVARLVDAALGRVFLEANGDRVATLETVLDQAERSTSLHALANEIGLQAAADDTRPLRERLQHGPARTLDLLADGALPDDCDPSQDPLTTRLLHGYATICRSIVDDYPTPGVRAPTNVVNEVLEEILRRADADADEPAADSCSTPPPSIFDLIEIAIVEHGEDTATCLLAVDAACFGLHRGLAVGAPQFLDYMRISGAEPTPLADHEFARDLIPHFEQIKIDENGAIDPASKLSGNQLANFSAFVSPRFRANDWMWGRMDSASGLVDILFRPNHLDRRAGASAIFGEVEGLITAPFAASPKQPEGFGAAAADVCRSLWEAHREEVQAEISEALDSQHAASALDGSDYLRVTRKLVTTRWHLGILGGEIGEVLAQPLEAEDPGTAVAPAPMTTGTRDSSRDRVQALLTDYEQCKRSVTDLWGRRRTTALGARVTERTIRAFVPIKTVWSWPLRVLLAGPLFFVAVAALSRGAFLLAWNLAVNVILLPRLDTAPRLVLGLSSGVLSLLFWKAFVKRKGGAAWRGWATGLITALLVGYGIAGTYVHSWPLQIPGPNPAPDPWGPVTDPGWDVLGSAIVVAAAAAIAAVLLFLWAKKVWIVACSVIVAVAFGGWTILGAWARSGGGSPDWLLWSLDRASSMWVPVIVLAVLFRRDGRRPRPR